MKKKETALYSSKGDKINKSNFIKSLKSVGVKEGDTIFVHSDVSVFGKLATLDRNLLLSSIIDSIREVVGNDGTIIVPTFSYSFCKNEIYDPSKTKSTVGTLTEYFRKQKGIIRTTHPIFSVAIWGKNKQYFANINHDSFDENSIFGKLHKTKGKILFLGAPFVSCTYLHYIEQMHGVPYRYIKKFKGKIKNKKIYKDEYTFFVRYLDRGIIFDTRKLEKHLIKKEVMKETMLGNGRILMVESNDLFNEGMKLLDKDIYYFLKEKPK